jgi:hypothetical protein
MTHDYRLKQFEFQNGGYFLNSILPISPRSLLVTHNQGAYIVDERGRVLRTLRLKRVRAFALKGTKAIPTGDADPLDCVSFAAKRIKARTIACITDAPVQTVLLLDLNLTDASVVAFPGAQVSSIVPGRGKNWIVSFTRAGHEGRISVR